MTSRTRIGINRDFAPFSHLADGRMSGLVVDRVEIALKVVSIGCDWLDLDLPDMMPALERGDVDVLCGVGASDERAEGLDLSAAIVTTGGAGFARSDSTQWNLEAGPASWAAAGARVVSPAAGPLLAPMQKVPDLHANDGVDYATSLGMVLDGSADIAALNFHVARQMIERHWSDRFNLPQRPYREIALVAAALKGCNGDFLAALNLGLSKTDRQPEPGS